VNFILIYCNFKGRKLLNPRVLRMGSKKLQKGEIEKQFENLQFKRDLSRSF